MNTVIVFLSPQNLGGLLGPHFVQETGIRTARFSVVCSEARDPSIVRLVQRDKVKCLLIIGLLEAQN